MTANLNKQSDRKDLTKAATEIQPAPLALQPSSEGQLLLLGQDLASRPAGGGGHQVEAGAAASISPCLFCCVENHSLDTLCAGQ